MFYGGIKCKLEGLFLSKRKQPHPSPAVANLVPSISFLIGAVVPAPPLLTPPRSQIPDLSHSPLSAEGLPFGSSTSDLEFSPNVCIHHSQLNLIHFCLNCMTPRRIPLKDSVYSLHSFLKGTYQGLGNMIESIPAHSSLCLPPPAPPPGTHRDPSLFSVQGPGASGGSGPAPMQSDLRWMSQPPGVRQGCVCVCVCTRAREGLLFRVMEIF